MLIILEVTLLVALLCLLPFMDFLLGFLMGLPALILYFHVYV